MHRLLAWEIGFTRPPRPRGSRWCTTSCSTCAAPSGCSSSCARCGPRRTSSPRSTTSTAPRDGSPIAPSTPRSCSGCVPRRARFARCCRCIRPRSSRSICRATTSSSRAPRRGRTRCSATSTRPRQLLPQPVSLRLERARPDARPRRNPVTRGVPARRRSAAGASGTGSPPSASTATSPTRSTTQARIRAYFGRDAHVVYPPVDTARFSPGPVGDHYAVVSELMPHKQIDVAVDGLQPAAAAARDRRRRSGRPPAAAAGRADGPASPGGSRTRRWPRCCRAPARWSSPRSRSSGSPPSRARPPAGR